MRSQTVARRLARSEREIGQLRADLESTQELTPTALIVVDSLHRIVRVNRIASELAGCAASELAGAEIDLVWPGFAVPEAGVIEPREVTWRDRGGAEIPMLV